MSPTLKEFLTIFKIPTGLKQFTRFTCKDNKGRTYEAHGSCHEAVKTNFNPESGK